MRGYVATVVGGCAGFWAAFFVGGYLFGRLAPSEGAEICESVARPYVCNATLLILGMILVFLGTVVCAALASAGMLWLIRDGAAAETGTAVAALVPLGIGLLYVVPARLTKGFLPSTPMVWALTLCIVACPFIAGRRVGVAWHRRRMEHGSWDAWLRRRTMWENAGQEPLALGEDRPTDAEPVPRQGPRDGSPDLRSGHGDAPAGGPADAGERGSAS